MTIFYFTGTGNALFAAKRIAEATKAELVSIPKVIDSPREHSDNVIGFVYPQYAIGLPKMVRRFVLDNTFKAEYIFAVDLFSFITAGALSEMSGIISLDYGAYLKTPCNFISMFNPPKDVKVAIQKTRPLLDRIIADIKARKIKRIRPSKHVGNATKYFGKNDFKVSDDCVRCGLCVRVCPAGNIVLDERIEFHKLCENCFACVNLCPQRAINSNIRMTKHRRYLNPEIIPDEIAEANDRNKNMIN